MQISGQCPVDIIDSFGVQTSVKVTSVHQNISIDINMTCEKYIARNAEKIPQQKSSNVKLNTSAGSSP